jgi:hypothetical protein
LRLFPAAGVEGDNNGQRRCCKKERQREKDNPATKGAPLTKRRMAKKKAGFIC